MATIAAGVRPVLIYLQTHPLCEECKSRGIIRAANVVDHRTPHQGDRTLFWAWENNWQALCKSCHDSKTAREDGRFGRKATGPVYNSGCDVNGMPTDPRHPWATRSS